jgi:hypothetical protein
MKNEDIERLVEDLNESTLTLSRLVVGTATIKQMEVHAASTDIEGIDKSFQFVRAHAQNLYSAVQSGLIHGCHPTHEANLRLETRMQPDEPCLTSSPGQITPTINFRLILSPKVNTGTAETLWYATSVDVIEDSGSKIPKQPSSAANPWSNTPSLGLQEVKDICKSIHQAQEAKRSLKLYLLNQKQLCCNHTQVEDKRDLGIAQCLSQPQNLEDILSHILGSQGKMMLTMKQRLALSLNLASSLLQLHSTPWLRESWTKKAILFTQTEPPKIRNKSNLSFLVDQPYVSSTFPHPDPGGTVDARFALLELGIMMLEVWHQEKLESHFSNTDLVWDSSYYKRLPLAERWMDETGDNIPDFFFEAADRCIRCRFDDIPARPAWDNQKLVQGLFHKVVLPLWNNRIRSK